MSRKVVGSSPVLDHYSTPVRRLASASLDALALLCEAISPFGLPARAFDRLDERLARSRRESFGRRCWVLSWHPEPGGLWQARLSGPDTDRTVERSARTRSVAILRSARAMVRIQQSRAEFAGKI